MTNGNNFTVMLFNLMCFYGSLVCFFSGHILLIVFFFFFQAEDGIRDLTLTGVQTCSLPISGSGWAGSGGHRMADLDAAAIARTAVDKATASARPQKLEPGRYTVILEPAAVASLLAFQIGRASCREGV